MDDSTEKKLPVSVDVGLKASLEVKAEIPKEETGRLVAALVDVIRPFTEKRGLRADLIRLQREDVALEIVKKALQRARIEQLTLNPIPTKLLIPFLEKASLEDTDIEMQDYWVALLLSASTSYHATQLTYTDILSRLSSQELKLLEEVCFSNKAFPEMTYPRTHSEENKDLIEANWEKLVIERERLASIGMTYDDYLAAHKAYEEFVQTTVLKYGAIMHAGVACFNSVKGDDGKRERTGTYWFYGENTGTARFRSIQILERERLVDIQRRIFPDLGTEIRYFEINPLGIDFVCRCSPQASKIAADRIAIMNSRVMS